jgi:hypothetical protein
MFVMHFAKRVPIAIVERTEENYYTYNMSLLDSFKEAVKELAKKGTKLWKAWYYDDFREYLPGEYIEEYLDFKKYPLKYASK